jgi:hypothetical protein
VTFWSGGRNNPWYILKTKKRQHKMTIKAIETKYNGYRFRSRLEARWAVFFDALGLRYEYEAEGFHTPIGGYLPDFWMTDLHFYIEVKPDRELMDEEIIKSLYLSSESNTFVLCGTPEPPLLSDGKVIRGACATSFSVCLDANNAYWNEEQVLHLAVAQSGWLYPDCFISVFPSLSKDIINDKGDVVGQLYRDVEYNGDAWHVYEIPTIQPDKRVFKHTYAVQCSTGRVVHVEPRPWLWHEWQDRTVNMWCYPDYALRNYQPDTVKKLKKGDFRTILRPQQSVARANTPRLLAAYEAARSARFEHGETPRVPRGKVRK